MADIYHDFPIKAPPERVYDAVSTPRGLDAWWTKRSSGRAVEGEEFVLWFGPDHDWRARGSRASAPAEFELEIVKADQDWLGTRVGFGLEAQGDRTHVRFQHIGWPAPNEHWRISCFCWAMYLRILRRALEYGEAVPYEGRLDA